MKKKQLNRKIGSMEKSVTQKKLVKQKNQLNRTIG